MSPQVEPSSTPERPTAAAVAAAAAAGAFAVGFASLRLSGRFAGSRNFFMTELAAAAVLAAATLCTWGFWRSGRHKEEEKEAFAAAAAAHTRQDGGVGAGEGASSQLLSPTGECCCGGACGSPCEGEGRGETDAKEFQEECDLEDIQSSGEEAKNAARAAARAVYVQPTASWRRPVRGDLQRDSQKEETDNNEEPLATAASSHFDARGLPDEEILLPGKAKIYFKTFGCSHNVSDSEYMQGLLHAAGYAFVSDLSEADVCVVNSCTVKSPSEFALYTTIKAAFEMPDGGLLEAQGGAKRPQAARSPSAAAASSSSADEDSSDAGGSGCASQAAPTASLGAACGSQQQQQQRPRRRIPCVVAGCVPGGHRGSRRGGGGGDASASAQEALLDECSVVSVSRISRIVEVVEEALQGRTVRLTGRSTLPPLDLPKIRRNRLIEIVPISTGCLGSCTYCKTKHARGELGSYSEEAIEARVRSAIAEGVTQIWLTSEDTGAYGLDIGSSLTKLLKRLLSLPLEERIMFRVGMSNPPFLLGQLAAATELLGHPNIFEFLQLPVQSGSNSVLCRMRREYTVEQFKKVVDACLKAHPKLSIMTDVICGFPEETEEDHRQTLKLLSEYRFPAVNISQFYSRPGTPAAAMRQLPSQVVKRRSREVTQLFESYTCYDWMVGTVHKVWFSSHSNRSEHTVGHTKQYVKVLVDRDDALLGRVFLVRMTAAAKWHCLGILCGPPEASLPAGGASPPQTAA